MGTNKTGSNDATMKLEYIIKLQVCLEKMNHMSYLKLKHTADSVSYIDSLERKSKYWKYCRTGTDTSSIVSGHHKYIISYRTIQPMSRIWKLSQ